MVLVMCMLTPCASMYAETEQSPYTYLNLDYATTTADDAAAVQLTEKGVILNVRPKRRVAQQKASKNLAMISGSKSISKATSLPSTAFFSQACSQCGWLRMNLMPACGQTLNSLSTWKNSSVRCTAIQTDAFLFGRAKVPVTSVPYICLQTGFGNEMHC